MKVYTHLAKRLGVSQMLFRWEVWCGFQDTPTNKPGSMTDVAVDLVAADCQDCLRAYSKALREKAGLPEGVAPLPKVGRSDLEFVPNVRYVEGPRPGADLRYGIDLKPPEVAGPSVLASELARVLNRLSMEQASNTPDFILGTYLQDCLAAWNRAQAARVQFKTSGEPSRPSMDKPITGW